MILGFIPDLWLQSLDFDTLERVSGTYITDDLRERADDVVWRIKIGDSWLYVYLILEFQSTVDPYMAVRMMTYVGLLYQDLIRNKEIQQRSQLPPVLPIVLYNGDQPWTAAQDIAEQIPHLSGVLSKFQPHMRYLLIEERTYADEQLAPLKNLVAAIFRLEQMPSMEEALTVVGDLKDWLNDPKQHELRRSVAIWVRNALTHHSEYKLLLPTVDNLQELYSMLSTQVGKWAQRYHHEGLQEGLQQGLKQGETKILFKQLKLRFGVLPEWVQSRLANADLAEIEIWSERILTASSLDGVFL